MTIGIGTMIGAGIFVLPGVAAQEAGPIVVLSFVIGGMIAMINALAVSELGTAMPRAGGAYYWINRSLGPSFGSIAGMGDWMGLAFASAFYCIGFGGYLAGMLGGTVVTIPFVGGSIVLLPSIDFWLFTLTDIQIGALIAGIIFVGVNYIGAKETGGVQTVIVLILLGILTVFAVAGWFHFDWSTVVGNGGLAPTEQGYGAVLPATALVFVSFLGYAKIATVAEELKNPGRNLPIAVIGSVGIVTVLYAILVLVMVGVIPWNELDVNVPVSQVAETTLAGPITVGELAIPIGGAGVFAISIGALLATASSANASILSSARINFAMGRDKIVSDWLNEIHPSFATPYRSILVTGSLIVVFIVALGQNLEVLAQAASVLHLIVYALMNAALIVFRETNPPDYDPVFTVPLYPITPILGATLSLGLIAFMAPTEIALSVLFVVGALLWYFLYARTETELEGLLAKHVLDRAEEYPDPAVTAVEAASPAESGPYRILVPVSNPNTERVLIDLACTLAAEREDGRVHAVHVVQVPDQMALGHAVEHREEIDAESDALLESARASAADYDLEFETSTIISHRSLPEVFDAAERHHADAIVMGWGAERPWSAGRAQRALDDLTERLPCDVLVLKDREFDPSRILLPTAGGHDSDLSAEVARTLRSAVGSEITLLHVVDGPDDREDGERFLAEWAAEHEFGDAVLSVDDTGDIEEAIAAEAADHTLMLIGATERGLLSRLLSDSLHMNVVDEVDCSVLLAERPSERSLRERLFGRQVTDESGSTNEDGGSAVEIDGERDVEAEGNPDGE